MFGNGGYGQGIIKVSNWLLLSFPVEVTKMMIAGIPEVDLRDAWIVNPNQEAVEALMREFPKKSFFFGHYASSAEHYTHTRREFSEECLQEILQGTLDPETKLGSYAVCDGRVDPKLLAEVLEANEKADKIYRKSFNWSLVGFNRLADFRKYGILDHKKVEISQEHASFMVAGYNTSGLSPQVQLSTLLYLIKCMPRTGEVVNQILASASRISADLSDEEMHGFLQEAFRHVGKQERQFLGAHIKCMNGHTRRQQQWMEPIQKELAAIHVDWIAARAKANVGGPKAAERSKRSAEFLRELRSAVTLLNVAPATWKLDPLYDGPTASQEEPFNILCEFLAGASQASAPTADQQKMLEWFRGESHDDPLFQSERTSTLARASMTVRFIRFAANNPEKVNWNGIPAPSAEDIFNPQGGRSARKEELGGLTYRSLLASAARDDLVKIIRSIPAGSNWRLFFGVAGSTACIAELTESERTVEVIKAHFRNSPHDANFISLPTIESMVKYAMSENPASTRLDILREIGEWAPHVNRPWPLTPDMLGANSGFLELLEENFLEVPLNPRAAARYMIPVCAYVYERGGVGGSQLFLSLLDAVDGNVARAGELMTLKEVVDTALAGAA